MRRVKTCVDREHPEGESARGARDLRKRGSCRVRRRLRRLARQRHAHGDYDYLTARPLRENCHGRRGHASRLHASLGRCRPAAAGCRGVRRISRGRLREPLLLSNRWRPSHVRLLQGQRSGLRPGRGATDSDRFIRLAAQVARQATGPPSWGRRSARYCGKNKTEPPRCGAGLTTHGECATEAPSRGTKNGLNKPL